jgi:hypothetical protein
VDLQKTTNPLFLLSHIIAALHTFGTYLPNHYYYYYYYQDAIGAMNFRQITKLGFAIDVTPFIVGGVMKWINVRTVVKLFVTRVQH